MGSKHAVATLLVVSSLALPFTAHADVSASDRETARALMEEGDKKREGGDLPGALKAFQQADAIMHVPTTGLEVAKVQARLGKLVEARDTLAAVLRLPVKAPEPAAFAVARKSAETMNAELGERIPSLHVKLAGLPPGASATIDIDGETIAGVGAPRKLNPGAHLVVVRAGGEDRRESVTLAEREARELTIDMAPKAVTPPPDSGEGKGGGPSKALMYGGFGVGAVGVVVGSITGIMSITKVSSIRESCVDDRCPPDKKADIDSAKDLGTLSTVAFIVGGIGIGAGVIGLLTAPKGDAPRGAGAARTTAGVTPEIGPGWAGLRGRF